MPITISWIDDEKTIIKHTYEGVWTVKDYYNLIRENYDIIDAVGHKVDIINDLRDTDYVPTDMIPAIRYAIQHRHPNEGVNIMVGAREIIQRLVEAVNKVSRLEITRVTYVDTVKEAIAIIRKEQLARDAGQDDANNNDDT